ncbi:MAG TPA: TonB-dependent receptor [Sphingobium sp.]
MTRGLTRSAFSLALTTSLIALAHPALAQDTPAAPAEATDTGLDIVVTATRRAQRQQDVPIAVTAYSAEELVKSSYKNPTDLQYLSPSVQVSASGGIGFNVRGVGTNSFNAATEQTVGLVVDGVVYGFVDDIGGDLSDVSRVEVLRGPQGTQFGKNASAGVVSISTERPTTDSLYSVGHVAYGSYNDTNASYRVNVPIADGLSGMLVGSYQNRDGWAWNPVKGKNEGDSSQFGIKGKLRFAKTDDFEAYISVDYRRSKITPNFLSTYRALGIGAGAVPPGFGILNYGIVAGPENTQTGISSESFRTTRTGGGSIELDYKLGGYTLTSLTAYRLLVKDAYTTLGGTPIVYAEGPSHTRSNQFSQELRLTSPGGQLVDFVAGLYYYRRHSKDESLLSGPFGGLAELLHGPGARISFSGGRDNTVYTVDSAAAYIDGAVNLTDKLHIILGGRFTHDSSKATLFTEPVANVYAIGGTINGPGQSSVKNDDFSWRAGVKYDVSSDIMAYFTAARGYKGPLAIAVAGSTARVVNPETVNSLEAGIKTAWFDKKMLLNLTLFREKFKNFQTSVLDTSLVPPGFVLGNAGGLKSQGVEVEMSVKPVHALTLTANGTYQDAKFTDFKASCYSAAEPIGLPVTTDPNATGACYTIPGTSTSYIQAAGRPIPNASKWNVTVAASYTQPVGGGLAVDATANYLYRSDFYTNGADPNTKVDGYGIANVNVGLGAEDGSWRVAAFARNLFDKYYISAIETGIFDTGGLVNVINPEARRTIGVMLDTRF